MATAYLSPGVYVEEVDRGAKPIEGVGTAVAAFVGFTERAEEPGRNGHPLAVPTVLCDEIRELDPAVGLKQLRGRHRLVTIEVDDPGVVTDVDTPDAYRSIVAASGDPDSGG